MQERIAPVEARAPAQESIDIRNDPPGYKWKVLATVIFSLFMVILDTTVVNVAFQTIRSQFGGRINDTQWVISIYVLALGITTPLAGFLADRVGAKRVYLTGLGLFAFGSLLCGLAPSLPLLIAARAIQGAGGGVVMPVGTAMLFQTFPPKEQGTALGIFGIAVLVAPAVGPILGGWLVDQNLWRVIFFINPPIGVIGVLLGRAFLREHQVGEKPRLDLAGVISEVIGFGAILYAASIASDRGLFAVETLTWFGIGIAGLVAFALVELKWAKNPLLDLRLYKRRIFLNATVLGYVSTIALFGAEFLMPLYLQALRGRTALETGLTLLPMAISGGIFVTLSGRVYDKLGPRPLLVVGFSLLVVNTYQLSQIQADTSINYIIFLLILRGMALGMTVQTTMVTALGVVPRYDVARGSSLTNATRLVVQSIGVAVLATVLASAISPQIKSLQNQFSSLPGATSGHPVGICELATQAKTGGIPVTGGQPVGTQGISPQSSSGILPGSVNPGIIQEACQENINGFEKAYKVTFYAAMLAVFLGVLLPGWPGKWAGRGKLGGHGTAMGD